MVICYKTRQLMKTSKYVTSSPGLYFSTYMPFRKKLFSVMKRDTKEIGPLSCDCRRFHSTDYFQTRKETRAAKLSPQEVDVILRANENTHEFNEGSVKSYDSNQLASNNPMEDTRSEATCLLTKGFLAGVFDGHSGAASAQVIAKRLFHYITACLLPHDVLTNYVKSLSLPVRSELVRPHNDKVQFVDDVRDIYEASLTQFLKELSELGYNKNIEVPKAMEKAFLRLDEDLSNEALPKEGQPINFKTMSVAMSGAVVCVAHIDGGDLHVANVGDCCAVLGTLSETNSWQVNKLTIEHNSYNQSEVDRIIKEHPYNECLSVIKMDRLLGQLAPLRSMGDFRFKWKKEIMINLIAKHFGEQVIPPNYHTPPYLTALPEVKHHRLTPRDKFLILATDGLWDIMTPLQAVRLVGEHMKGKVTLSPLKLPRKNMTLNEINEMLLQRKEGLKTKPRDSNAATHIIRNALGGTEFGLDHLKISQLLTLPEDVVRVFRDDISVTIVYFDSDFLRHCPP
nr:pyruvate dehydrogenase [acetyl-transferring]-phosphatase 1, mitochondrial [Leptinotarsa decemlineata]